MSKIFANSYHYQPILQIRGRNIIKRKTYRQAEAEIVPSSSLVEVEVGVGVEVMVEIEVWVGVGIEVGVGIYKF